MILVIHHKKNIIAFILVLTGIEDNGRENDSSIKTELKYKLSMDAESMGDSIVLLQSLKRRDGFWRLGETVYQTIRALVDSILGKS